MTTPSPADRPDTDSPWTPLGIPAFRALWLAAIASNLGTWAHEVGAAWLMTSLTSSPTLVALVQAAATLPMFLLALPAGVAADLFDRRKILLLAQGWMAASAFLLAASTWLELVTPPVLLLLTASLAIGMALSAPAWQAITPELVGFGALPKAVALNSMGFNVARALGPAMGGLLLALAGPWANFAVNALSFSGVLLVLLRWRREPERSSLLPEEGFLGALRLGMRYVFNSPRMKTVLLRSGLFVLPASAWWALLPVVARFSLDLGPGGYGALVGCFGAGAVCAAWMLPPIRKRLDADALSLMASGIFAVSLVILAVSSRGAPGGALAAGGAAVLGGGGWLTVLSGYNVAAQSAVPAWVRARALSIYMLVFFGSLSLGSALWGTVAEQLGSFVALLGASAALLLGLFSGKRRLGQVDPSRLAPSRHWPTPLVHIEPEPEGSEVLITVEYRVDPSDAEEFMAAMWVVGRSRRRAGSVRWGLWNDTADPERWVESFVDESWTEYLRHHERLTGLDASIEGRATAFHRGEEPPVVSHYVAVRRQGR
ncbi:MAG: MFS transporter [Thermoanaerobaculia bacterium]|nr:MFS transporter [Thermoanaerobaculia bacterium]